jgi:hypothetical protein
VTRNDFIGGVSFMAAGVVPMRIGVDGVERKSDERARIFINLMMASRRA